MICNIDFTIKESDAIDMSIDDADQLSFECNVQSISGTSDDYNVLKNKPQINSVTLIGNLTSEELGLEPTIKDITEQDVDEIIFG